MPTISVHVVRGAFVEAMARGQELPALCERFGVAPDALADPDARVDVGVMCEIWLELPRLIGLDTLGLAMARRVQETGSLPVLSHFVRAAGTVRQGLEFAHRYQHILQDAQTSHWEEDEHELRVTFQSLAPSYPIPRQSIEFTLASLLLLVRGATGRREWGARSIAFEHARPKDDSEARALFGCPLEYDAPANSVRISQCDLQAPQITSDPHLITLLERHARELERRLPTDTTLASAVERALADLLSTGESSLDAVAQKLRLSSRTVQRRLREEGTTLQRVLETLRHKLAVQHLGEGALGIKEIAFLLGFSDQSAFHHAFVRWTGQAPGEFRRTLRTSP